MSLFAILRSTDDLARFSDDLSRLLPIWKRHDAAEDARPLLGIWVDSDLVARGGELPRIARPALRRRETRRINDSIGVVGIWTLHHLDQGEGALTALVDELEAAAAREQRYRPRFVPVFAAELADRERELRLETMRRRWPGLVLEPLLQDSRSGRLLSLCGSDSRSGEGA